MMPKPCEITGCPALSEIDSRWCAVHRAMSDAERADENRDGERRNFRLMQLKPVTDRIAYEKKR